MAPSPLREELIHVLARDASFHHDVLTTAPTRLLLEICRVFKHHFSTTWLEDAISRLPASRRQRPRW
jgi:hypothetical protein